MTEYMQKLFSSRVINGNANIYIGEAGQVFYDQYDGLLRLSDGVTPGGKFISSGGGGTYDLVAYDCGSASTPNTNYVLMLDMGNAN